MLVIIMLKSNIKESYYISEQIQTLWWLKKCVYGCVRVCLLWLNVFHLVKVLFGSWVKWIESIKTETGNLGQDVESIAGRVRRLWSRSSAVQIFSVVVSWRYWSNDTRYCVKLVLSVPLQMQIQEANENTNSSTMINFKWDECLLIHCTVLYSVYYGPILQ